MKRRIASVLFAVMLGITFCPVSAYAAKENKAYEAYLEAKNATTASGNWTENIVMEADLTLLKDRSRIKTKVRLDSDMVISNYSKENMSILGSVKANIMEQHIAYDVRYENGVAHYQYTEPKKMEADLEIKPDYYDFNNMTEESMKKAKISGNRITFTIPGNEVENAGTAAVKFMPDMESVEYNDASVELILDEETGMIKSMNMDCSVSLTYQGYDAEMNYHINCNIQANENSNDENDKEQSTEADTEETLLEDGMYLYSDHTNLSIRKDEILTLNAEIVKDGRPFDDVSGITVTIGDASVLDLNTVETVENKRCVRLNGIGYGTTEVTFQDALSGYIASVEVTVYQDNCLSYTLENVPSREIEKYPTNFYNVNGLYIDNYKYEKQKDQSAKVSFDVYNTNYTYGSVEIYREDGSLYNVVLIEKMKFNNTSMKEALFDNSIALVKDQINGTFLTYRQETGFSKRTEVEVEIPQNGYIKISNDAGSSSIVSLVNSADILMTTGALAKKMAEYDSDVFTKNMSKKLVKEYGLTTMMKDGSKFPLELSKKLAQKVGFSSKALGEYCETITNTLEELNVDEIIIETGRDMGIDMATKIFTYFTGPVKEVLDGLFAFGKISNIIRQCNDFSQSIGVGAIYIQNPSENFRVSQQIKVENRKGFSSDTALNVFRVELSEDTLENLRECAPVWYKELTNDEAYTYNISLLKNGEEIQPDGKVTVSIPIPEKLKFFAYFGGARVYRVEEDGSLTKMEPQIEGDCFVFDTEHFSVYTLVGNEKLQMYVLIGGTAFLGLFILLLLVRRRRK